MRIIRASINICSGFHFVVVAVHTDFTKHSSLSTASLPGSVEARTQSAANCIDGIYDIACWDRLDIPKWLPKWYDGVPECKGTYNVDTFHCRAEGEPWTSTFLRMALNVTGGLGCTELFACQDNPPTSKDIISSEGTMDAARYRYVCYNIYGMTPFSSI